MGETPQRIGRYLLFEPFAVGGMATVHLGRLVGPIGFSRTVAIKRLHPAFARDPEIVAMLMDEARLAARIRHPNVAAVIDVLSVDDELCLVMEYVHGLSLAMVERVAGTEWPPPRPIAVGIGIQILLGLHAAHEACNEHGAPLAIVHRDVSPQNIVVGTDGGTRLIDFGVAKALWRSQSSHTGQLKGKIQYMAPEQLRGRPIDRRADVFAAGIVLWEMLTGRRLFEAIEPGAVLDLVLRAEIPLPSHYADGISTQLDAVVMRALSRPCDMRFPTASAMAAELEALRMAATHPEIARWMEHVASASLAERVQALAAVENHELEPEETPSWIARHLVDVDAATMATMPTATRSNLVPLEPSTSPTLRSSDSPTISWTPPAPPVRRGRTRRWARLTMGALVAVGTAALVAPLLSSSARHRVTPVFSPSEKPSVALPIDLAELASPSEQRTVSSSPLVLAPPRSVAKPSRLPRPAAMTPSKGSVETAPSAPLPAPSAEPIKGCVPPFDIDPDGVRVYKLRCL